MAIACEFQHIVCRIQRRANSGRIVLRYVVCFRLRVAVDGTSHYVCLVCQRAGRGVPQTGRVHRTISKLLYWARNRRNHQESPQGESNGHSSTDLLVPKLSVPGVLLVCLLALIVSTAATLSIYYSDLKSELTGQANARVASFDLLLGSALEEMQALSVLDISECDGTVIESLVKSSMDSAIARRFYALTNDRQSVCSPLSGIGDPAAQMLLQKGSGNIAPITLLVVTDASNDVLLISEVGLRSRIAAQIPGNLIRDLLGLRDKTGIATIKVKSWDGGSLLDTGWDEPYGFFQSEDLLTVEKDSESMPVTVRASARKSDVIDGVWRYLLAALLLSVLVAALVIARINLILEHRASTLSRIKLALVKRQFEPVIQPIVECNSGRCVGGEILMRWQHPVRGLLAPIEFIDIAERNGLIDSMTVLIMTKARDRLAALVKENPDLYFSFNVTASQLRRRGFADEMDRIFDQESLPGENVVLEIIERDVLDAGSRQTLSELRRRGYRIAIDDFGTGQSSLALLTTMPFDMLKIDREFVRAIDSESVQRSVLSAIVDLAGRLGVRSIAEGVETVSQHRFLIQQGVNAIQGFLMARPMPIPDFYTWLAENRSQARYQSDAGATVSKTLSAQAPGAVIAGTDFPGLSDLHSSTGKPSRQASSVEPIARKAEYVAEPG